MNSLPSRKTWQFHRNCTQRLRDSLQRGISILCATSRVACCPSKFLPHDCRNSYRGSALGCETIGLDLHRSLPSGSPSRQGTWVEWPGLDSAARWKSRRVEQSHSNLSHPKTGDESNIPRIARWTVSKSSLRCSEVGVKTGLRIRLPVNFETTGRSISRFGFVHRRSLTQNLRRSGLHLSFVTALPRYPRFWQPLSRGKTRRPIA